MFNWFAFLTYAVITAATPGPNNIVSMSNGGRLGFKGALPFNFGILAGFAAVMLICTAFCSTLTELIPAVKTPMLIAGAAICFIDQSSGDNVYPFTTVLIWRWGLVFRLFLSVFVFRIVEYVIG